MSENNIPHIVDQGSSYTKPGRKPLTKEQIEVFADHFLKYQIEGSTASGVFEFVKAIETYHGIE